MSVSPCAEDGFRIFRDEPLTRGVVVARILEVRPHPNAQKIRLAVIDIGDGAKHQVVFGGYLELVPGDLVPAAPPRAWVPFKGKMRRRNYRGQSSYGMLCSSDELGWTMDGIDEVALLVPTLEVGRSLDDDGVQHLLRYSETFDEGQRVRTQAVYELIDSTPNGLCTLN